MRKYLVATMILASVGLAPLPAYAQSAIEGRVDRLEGEMRAVQRKVFPGGSGQYVQPQITPPAPDGDLPGSPASSPVADLNARVNALESQMSGLTGQIETTQHKLQLIEEAFNAYKRTTDARLKVLEDSASSTTVGAAPVLPATGSAAASTKPTVKPPVVKPTTGARPVPPAVALKDPERLAKIAAIEKPRTDDPAEDAYLYGYRLWQGKYYPEAEAQFKQVVATWPKHKRASYAQNLLGRSYLEDNKPSLAALAFYDNYKTMPDGDRAPDSLFYLAQALKKAGKPSSEVCKVYDELSDVYAARMSETMKADVKAGRTEAKCK